MFLRAPLSLTIALVSGWFTAVPAADAANPASPGSNVQALTIPAPENIPLPKGLTGFVSMRLGKLSAVLEGVLGKQKWTINDLLRLEPVCGVPASGVSTLCFASRSSDKKGALLVSTREPLSLEKAAGALGLAAEKPVPFGTWTQVTIKSAGKPAMLAIQTGPNDLLVLHTTKPEDETPATITALAKDLTAMRSAVATGPAAFWGRVDKTPGEEPFAGNCLPGITKLASFCAPLHFDVRMNPGGFEIRFALAGSMGSSAGLSARCREVFETAATEGLKHPPVWRGAQSKGVFSACVTVPVGFLEESLEGLVSNTKIVKAKRNAQNLASLCAAARAAGCDQLDGVREMDKVIDILRKGVSPAEGQFTTTSFKIKLSDNEATAAAEYLTLTENGLEYTPDEAPKVTAENKARVFDAWDRLLETAVPDSPYENGQRVLAYARRNAQNAASACAAARAAGATEFDGLKRVDEFLKVLNRGAKGAGQFANSVFRLELEPAEALAAAKYLECGENGDLIYKPELEE